MEPSDHEAGSVPQEPERMRPVEVVDVVVALPNPDATVVLAEIDPPHRILRFPVAWCDGVALSYALGRAVAPRPLTHETFVTVLATFGVSLEVVRITGISGMVVFAELVLSAADGRKEIDCRPSDALALALRQPLPVPIVVSEAVLDALGEETAPRG